MKTIYALTTSFLLALGAEVKAQLTTTLNPVQDAYFISMGGGQGNNPILKFNISSIPPGSNITKATLQVYVFDTTNATHAGPINGNMIFRNLNNKQNWTETDSAYSFAPNQSMYSDSVIQASGFGDSIGWASSADLKSIILRDFNPLDIYCTISMKDPDDVTCCGAMGPNFSSFLANSMDSIVCGNKMVGCDQMIFYPKDYANVQFRPKLVIEYTCSKSSNQVLSLCAGDSVTIGTAIHKTTGVYNDTLTGVFGCDSIVTSNITVKPAINVSVAVSGNSITASEVSATYQWIDCSNSNANINGETGQTYNVSASGSYAVMVTKNGCTDTSACTNIVFTGIGQLQNSGISIKPNPTHDIVEISIANISSLVLLTDMLGRTIYQSAHVSEKVLVDLRAESKGIYLLKVTDNGKTEFFKIIKD